MSKFTLADRLRDIAGRIEKLPEDAELIVRINCHSSHSADLTMQCLELGTGCENSLVHFGTSDWFEFNQMHGEPIELRVFYNPEVVKGVSE